MSSKTYVYINIPRRGEGGEDKDVQPVGKYHPWSRFLVIILSITPPPPTSSLPNVGGLEGAAGTLPARPPLLPLDPPPGGGGGGDGQEGGRTHVNCTTA